MNRRFDYFDAAEERADARRRARREYEWQQGLERMRKKIKRENMDFDFDPSEISTDLFNPDVIEEDYKVVYDDEYEEYDEDEDEEDEVNDDDKEEDKEEEEEEEEEEIIIYKKKRLNIRKEEEEEEEDI